MAEFSGQLSLRAAPNAAGQTTLAAQAFRAPYHLSKPYWDPDSGTLLVQVVNPTAGILAGDRLESSIAVESRAALLVTAPSASRLFQMQRGNAECRQELKVAAGGWLEVLPEPLVPHRGSHYRQSTRIDVVTGSELFFADLLLPGRVAHGEAWEWEQLTLQTEVRVDGELVLSERFAQSGADFGALAQLGGPGGAAGFGNALLLAAPREGDETWLKALRQLATPDLQLGVSALRRGGWSIKWIAADSARLRQALRDLRGLLATRFTHLRCNPRKL